MKTLIKKSFLLISIIIIGLYSISLQAKGNNQQIELTNKTFSNEKLLSDKMNGAEAHIYQKTNPRKKTSTKLSKKRKRQNLSPKKRVKLNSKKYSSQFKTPGIMKFLNS